MKEKRISFIIENLDGGGAERVITNLMNYLVDSGWKVDLILVRKEGVFLQFLNPAVTIFELPVSNLLSSLIPLIRHLIKHQPSVIISSLDLMNAITILAVKLSGVKTKIICRVDNTISLQKRTLIKKVIEKMLYRFVISRADRIVIVSGTAAEDLSEYAKIPEDRIRTIFNPVITNDITAKKQVQPDHQWYEAGIPVVLAIGRLTPVKNFSWLIQVFSLLLEKVDARLIILGEGQERGELQNMISDLHLEEKIDLPGFVDNPFAYMQNSNAFVLTSLYEGLPTVLIEAMACGCPIVSVDCPSGPAEILGGGEFGYLVPMGEKETFVDALVNTIEGRVEQVPSAWLEQFTLEYVAEQYLDEIEKLME